MPSFLLCSTPVHGHVVPLLAVADYLVRQGHRVRFLTGARFRDAVLACGAEHLPLPAGADYDDRDVAAAFPDRPNKSGVAGIQWDISNIFLKPAALQFAALEAALEAEPVDAILVEGMFVGTSAVLTRPRSARPAVVQLGIVPLGLSSPDTAPYGLGLPPLPGTLGRVRNAALGFFTRKVLFASVQKDVDALMQELTGVTPGGFFLDGARAADAIVQFTVPGFEYPRRDLPDSVHFVGPVSRGGAMAIERPSWWHELDGSRPVVHVSQGTIANRDYEELILPTVRALADENVLVVVSTGGRAVSTLPGPLPQNVRVAAYLNYDELLPRTDVFVTNGGYGGVHHALSHGVPLVVAGTTEDKPEVAARVQWSGAGIRLRGKKPAPSAVATAVRTILARPEHGRASAALGVEIAASSGLPGLERVLTGLIAASPHT